MKNTSSTKRHAGMMLLIALLFLHVFNFECGNDSQNQIIYDSYLINEPLNDSLPHYKHKRLSDSINIAENYQKFKPGNGSSTNLGPIGFGKYSICDTCSSLKSDRESVRKTKYYFILDGYLFDHNSNLTFINGKNILKYPVWDSTVNNTKIGHYEKKELKIGFEDNPFKKNENKLDKYGSVYIPVSKTTYSIISVLLTVLSIVGIIFAIYLLIFLPFTTLAAIASGAIFTKRNIKNLLIMGWSFITIFFVLPISGLLINAIFNPLIPPEIVFPFWESLFNNKTLLIVGVIILLLADAFKSGYKLQQEQDLTV